MQQFTNFKQEETQEAPVRKKMEDITESHLKKHGFNVIRVPGRFNFNSRNPSMNFFNMVTAKTPKGKNIAVLLGCENEEYKKYFIELLEKNSDRKIDEFHFLSLEPSKECLIRGGGISCRTKTIPNPKHQPRS